MSLISNSEFDSEQSRSGEARIEIGVGLTIKFVHCGRDNATLMQALEVLLNSGGHVTDSEGVQV